MSSKPDSGKERKDKPTLFRRLSRSAFSKSEIKSPTSPHSPSESGATSKAAVDRMEKWSKQQLLYWIDANKLKYLKWHYLDEEERKSLKAKHVCDQTRMWVRHPSRSNLLTLSQAPASVLVSLATLPPDSNLRKIWQHDEYIQDFIYMLPCILSPSVFLDELEKRYKFIPTVEANSDDDDADDILESKPVEATSAMQLLRLWALSDGCSDLAADPELYKQFKRFCEKVVSKEHATDARELRKRVDSVMKEFQKNGKAEPVQLDAPPAILPKSFKDLTILDLDPLEIARQMTLMEFKLFRQLRPREFHKQAWNKAGKELKAPNLNMFTNHANKMINWVTTEILKVPETSERAQIITKFIRTSVFLKQLNNFNGVMEILSSLHSSAISRLKLSWSEVKDKDKDAFQELTDQMSNTSNFKQFRELWAAIPSDEPTVFLTDCVYLDDVGSDKTENGWVNWSKLEGLARKIRDIIRPEMKPYNLHSVRQIQQFIEEAESWNDTKALYAISQLSESKQGTGVADNSGFASAARRAGGSTPARRGLGARRSTVSNLQNFRQPVSHGSNSPTLLEPIEDPHALSERDWKILLAGATLLKYDTNQIISPNADDGRFIYRILRGRVKIERTPEQNMDADTPVVAIIGPQELVCEVSLLKSHRASLAGRLVALEPTEIYQLSTEFVLKLCESESDLSERLHRILALKLAKRLKFINAHKSRSPRPESVGTPNQGLTAAVVSAVSVEEDETKRADARFVKKFGLPSSEVIIRAVDCSLKQKVVSHGTLYISQGFICYAATVFGLKKKEVIPLATVTQVEKNSSKNLLIFTDSDKPFLFTAFDNVDEVADFLSTLWQTVADKRRKKVESGSSTDSPSLNAGKKTRTKSHSRGSGSDDICHSPSGLSSNCLESIADNQHSIQPEQPIPLSSLRGSSTSSTDDFSEREHSSSDSTGAQRDTAGGTLANPLDVEDRRISALRARFDLTEEDWESILRGASLTTYNKDQAVITEGDRMQRIYQIGRGSCRIEKTTSGDQRIKLGEFSKEDGVFGEISFLEGGSATASVVADEPETAVHIIEGYFLDVLFSRTPGLSGRFFHYLASLLAKRSSQREMAHFHTPRPNKPLPPLPPGIFSPNIPLSALPPPLFTPSSAPLAPNQSCSIDPADSALLPPGSSAADRYGDSLQNDGMSSGSARPPENHLQGS